MREYLRTAKLMGSAFELLVVHENEDEAEKLLDAGINEIKRIENLLSEFLPDSETTRINTRSTNALEAESEFLQLVERSLGISKLTKGCFDITVSPLKKLYSFKNSDFRFPRKEEVAATLKKVGYQSIQTTDKEIRFDNSKTEISFAAIGKGYASDKVKELWKRKGVTSGYVNASGDLNAFGRKADGSQWNIGIANPQNTSEMLMYIPVENASVATSGDYEQYFTFEGRRYSHNINPHTGKPLSGLKSVSVFSPSAELSDALATAVYVMGREKGIDFINQLPKTHAIIIDDSNEVWFSKHINYEETLV